MEPRPLLEPFPEEDLDAGSGFPGGAGVGNENEEAGIDSCESAGPGEGGVGCREDRSSENALYAGTGAEAGRTTPRSAKRRV